MYLVLLRMSAKPVSPVSCMEDLPTSSSKVVTERPGMFWPEVLATLRSGEDSSVGKEVRQRRKVISLFINCKKCA